MEKIIQILIQTEDDPKLAFIRIIAGIIILPYGVQKVFSYRGWWGIKGTIASMDEKKIPLFITWLIIIGQFAGSLALLVGFAGRFAAFGNLIIFSGAMISHRREGWMMNWFNTKKGEGIEYFVMLVALLLLVAVYGSGAYSLDLLYYFFLQKSLFL